MKSCKLILLDEVTFKLEDVPYEVRRKIHTRLKFENPAAKYMKGTRLSGWDGSITYFNLGGSGYIHHLEIVLEILEQNNITVGEFEDKRIPYKIDFDPIEEDYWGQICWPPGHNLAGQPIRLRDYQVEAANNFLKTPQGIQQLPTASGKTIILSTLSKLVEPLGRSIIIVPNISLVNQTLEDYICCGLDVGVYYGAKKEVNKTHTICTWQSLDSAVKNKKTQIDSTNHDIDALAETLIAVICDETHMVKGNVLKKMLSQNFKHVPIRWGLTGTIPKQQHEFEALRSTLGPVIAKIKPKTLQDAGYLSNCQIHIKQLYDYPAFSNYQEELKYLVLNPDRIKYITEMIKKIKDSGNTLVLVDRIKAGELICDEIDQAVFVSGTMKVDDRKTHYDSINDSNDRVIVATYHVAAVGINLVNIHNVVLIEPGKSFVRVIQSIGRGLRKSSTKDFVDIWDITSTCKFSKKHLTERKKFYKESEYDFKIEKIEWSNT